MLNFKNVGRTRLKASVETSTLILKMILAHLQVVWKAILFYSDIHGNWTSLVKVNIFWSLTPLKFSTLNFIFSAHRFDRRMHVEFPEKDMVTEKM